MRVLITGARGFVGSYLVKRLESAGHSVLGVDYEEGDLTLPKVAWHIIGNCEPNIVVHLAAKVGRLFGEEDPRVTISSNTLATVYVAQACAKFGARLVYASTSEAFGDPGDDSVDEGEHGVLPHNLYGLSKRWGEEAAQLYAPRKLQILRLSMPYGPGLPAGWGRAAVLTFLWLAHHRRQITVHRGGRRCLCWIGDLVAGIQVAIEDGGGGSWSIGRDDNEVLMLDVAHRACRLAGAPTDLVTEIDAPPNQTLVKRLNINRLTALGWSPGVDLPEGMDLTYRMMRLYDDKGMPPEWWREKI